MKTMLVVPLVALALVGCEKPVAVVPVPEPTPPVAVAVEPAPSPAVAPAEAPAAPVVAEVPKRELAPPGVFYVLQLVRIETPDGIIGLKPGEGVKEVGPGRYLTAHGEFPLPSDSLTNDMQLAREAKNADAGQQAALKARGAQMAADARAAQVARDAQTAEQMAQLPAPDAPARPRVGSSLDKGAYDEDKGVAKGATIVDGAGRDVGRRMGGKVKND